MAATGAFGGELLRRGADDDDEEYAQFFGLW